MKSEKAKLFSLLQGGISFPSVLYEDGALHKTSTNQMVIEAQRGSFSAPPKHENTSASEVGDCRCQNAPNIFFWLDKPRLSQSREIKFLLFTRASLGNEGFVIEIEHNKTIYESGFDPDLPLTVVTHGWAEGVRDKWVYPMKNELLRKAKMNVVVLDWESLSRKTYAMSVKFSKLAGILLAKFLYFLKDLTRDFKDPIKSFPPLKFRKQYQETYPNFTGAQVHLIGFSMGAHASGIAGNLFPGIARITGLDPAGPSYECVKEEEVLDASDAHFVDIIHTNSGCLSRGHLGFRIPTAHQNFYVNGGGRQPGCPPFFLDAVVDVIFGGGLIICHHTRAVEYFLESINNDKVAEAFSCPDYRTFKTGACLRNIKTAFGYPASFISTERHHRPLTLFLDTQGKFPFLSKQVEIGARLLSRGDGRVHGDVEILFLLPTQTQQKITLVRYGTNIHPDKYLVNMIVIPIAMDIGSLRVNIAYKLPVFRRPAANHTLNILGIVALDTNTNERYCVTSSMSLTLANNIDRRPRKGPC